MQNQPVCSPMPQSDPRRITFRLVHVVYVVTLLATSVATFGATGLIPGIVVSVFWAVVFTSQSRIKAFGWALFAVIAVGCLGMLFTPASGVAREASRRMSCANNMKQIALALHNYHDAYGSFPPAFVTDEDGVPMHSWRVLILPFVEAQPLYAIYRFDEPWNGPNNIKLLDNMPPCYQCPSSVANRHATSRFTGYLAVVGERTVWPGKTVTKLADIVDGSSSTVLVVECKADKVLWTEPRDLEFQAALGLLCSNDEDVPIRHMTENFFFRYYWDRHVAFGDGEVRSLGKDVGPAVWSDVLIRDDGNGWTEDDLPKSFATKQFKVGNWLRLGILIVLVVLPLPWVCRNIG